MIVCLALSAGAPPLAFAAAGALDKAFNGTGLVTTTLPGGLGAAHVALDGQGRLIVVGTVSNAAPAKEDFAVARYLPNGALDTTFGPSQTGIVVTDFGNWDRAAAVAIDSQGRIVVVGTRRTDFAADHVMLVARYLPNGDLDTSFHGGSTPVFHDVAGDNDTFGNAVAIDDQNRIIAAGKVENGNDDFFVVRLNSDGQLDSGFGRNAIGFGGHDTAASVVLDAQGRIVVVGDSFDTDTSILPEGRVAVARLNADGSLDDTFDDDGKLEADVEGKDSRGVGVAIDAIGRIVVVGSRILEEDNLSFQFGIILLRFQDDGSLDQLFGSGGKVALTAGGGFPQDFAIDVAIDHLGRIIVGGGTGGSERLALLRFSDQGVLDAGFQGAGTVPGWTILTNRGWVHDLLIDAQGRIVTVGGSGAFELARFNNDPVADLRITKLVSGGPFVPGDPVSYSITVSNVGPDEARNVQVTDVLPAAVTFASCSANGGGACGGAGNNRTIAYASLASGASSTIAIAATLNQGIADGTIVSNTAEVSALFPGDPDSSNNSASAAFTVNNRADLLVVQSAAKLTKQQLSFTIKVRNNGPYAARQILLNNPMPTETTFVSVNNGEWTCTPLPVGFAGTLSCTLPNLNAVGGFTEATVIFNVKSTAPAGASITNTATVTAATYDPNLANNTSTLITRMAGNGK
jgi:uncharacterized repeat protein (TIGR01451 family)/uncharacterized delta-60 repeat protein